MAAIKELNRKRVYRLINAHGLLLLCRPGGEVRRDDDNAVERALVFDRVRTGCDNGEKVRIAITTARPPPM